MKIYYVCECCDQVFRRQESGDAEGAVSINGLCPDCATEIGLSGSSQQSLPPIIYQ